MRKEFADNPDEIREARELLRRFESSDVPSERIECFRNGMCMLNDYLEEHPDCPAETRSLIDDVKLSHARVFLKGEKSIFYVPQGYVLEYLLTLAGITKERKELMLADPALRTEYEEFLVMWEAEKLVKGVIKKRCPMDDSLPNFAWESLWE